MDTIRPTRYPDLGYMEHGGIWRIVTTEDGAAVGPQYATKAELLADLDRYAAEYLGKPDPRDARIRELESAAAVYVRTHEGYAQELKARIRELEGALRELLTVVHDEADDIDEDGGVCVYAFAADIEAARRILAEGSVKA